MMKTNNLSSPPRQRTSVAIQGLDRSTPDDLVLDGKCEELHNLRYKEGAWRPVHPHRSIEIDSEFASEHTIVYHHPAAGENVYIAQNKNTSKGYHYFSINIDTGESVSIAGFINKQRISHFGNVLIFSGDNTTTYYMLNNGKYGRVSSQLPLPKITVSYKNLRRYDTPYVYFKLNKEIHLDANYPILPNTYCPSTSQNPQYYGDILDKVLKIIQGDNTIEMTVAYMLYNESDDIIAPSFQDAGILGNIAFFVAYRGADGSILQVSPLALISRDDVYNVARVYKERLEFKDPYSNATGMTADEMVWAESKPVTISIGMSANNAKLCPLLFYTPSIKIEVPSEVLSNSIVESVAIYATRPNSPFDRLRMRAIGTTSTSSDNKNLTDIYSEDNIFNQPFYILKEYHSGTVLINNQEINIDVTPDMMERLVDSQVFVPTSLTPFIGNIVFDYNNRLHIGDTTTIYNKSLHLKHVLALDNSGQAPSIAAGAEIETNDGILNFFTQDYLPSRGFLSPYEKVLSYPDIYVKAFLFRKSGDNYVYRRDAILAIANGFSFYIQSPTNESQFPKLSPLAGSKIEKDLLISDTIIRHSPNKLVVSLANNCFSFPYEQTYTFGSDNNRILAMQSAAIEMHEMKVGELPLYVFTEEGIYALVAGQNTLYASVAAINYDKIINPNTLAINGAIVYITEKGVHLLTSAGTQVISQPIHGANGIPPLDFLRRCKIIWPKQYNEIVLLDEESTTGKAYVYNLDAGYWSTRTLSGTKLNTDELYYSNALCDLADEDESRRLEVNIVTRPIKLGNVEFKRLETIIPRMQVGIQDKQYQWDLAIEGALSPDLEWQELRHIGDAQTPIYTPLLLRRTPFSAKYFRMRFSLSRDFESNFSISHIDFEWYERFKHRMR